MVHTPQQQRANPVMIWTSHAQQQQRGAQLHARTSKPRQQGEPPAEALADRAAQDHDRAGATPQAGDYPASSIENRNGEAIPSAPDTQVDWDDIVQPERQQQGESDDLPLPEGE